MKNNLKRIFNVLYVDDEISNLNVFRNTFRRDYNIFTAESAKEGLGILDREKIDLILTDQRMPEMSGVEFLKQAILQYPEPNRILITAYTDFNALRDAVNEARIFQYIQKPWDEKEIKQVIDDALEIYFLKQKNIELTGELQFKNKELERLNNELIDLDKLKFQFLKIISHEIRTPLNGLYGVTALFRDVIAPEDYRKYQQLYEILDISTERLGHFLLLAERITSFQARNYEVSAEVVDLRELVSEAVRFSEGKMAEKNIRPDLQLFDGDTGDCYAEKQLIEICLSEILDNAIKYTERGGRIVIKSHIDGENILIEITDQGSGFPEFVLKNLFKPFITEEGDAHQGIGLNLMLIKQIVEVHHGKMEVFNNKDKGATVRLAFRKHVLNN